MQGTTKEEIEQLIAHVVELNIKDAEQLIETMEKAGDGEGLERAKRDLEKWEAKDRQTKARAANQENNPAL